MKRRELIKSTILSTVGAMTLSGCHSGGGVKIDNNTTNNIDSKDDVLEIVPKQTGVYEFSTALPFDYKLIDSIAELNQKYKKSRVVTLFNNVPKPCANDFNDWLMVLRGENFDIKRYEDFIKYAKYAKELGFEICYLFNSPKPFSKVDYMKFKNNFERLLDLLYKADIKHIKFGNTQVASLINNYDKNKEFTLSASTALEYHNISQYINLIENYPNIKLIDISIDENHNFRFLKNLKKFFPNIKLELMVNEGCPKGCHARIYHISSDFCAFDCDKIHNQNPIKTIFKMPAIYPWHLEYYSAIGINNFKLISRIKPKANNNDLNYLKNYLNCVEYGIDDDYTLDRFCLDTIGTYHLTPLKEVRLSHIKPYLHDIEWFVKHGDKCASRCGSECRHCDKMAARLEEFLRYL